MALETLPVPAVFLGATGQVLEPRRARLVLQDGTVPRLGTRRRRAQGYVALGSIQWQDQVGAHRVLQANTSHRQALADATRAFLGHIAPQQVCLR